MLAHTQKITGFQKFHLKKTKTRRLKRQLSLQSNSLPETKSAINIKSGQTKKSLILIWMGERKKDLKKEVQTNVNQENSIV